MHILIRITTALTRKNQPCTADFLLRTLSLGLYPLNPDESVIGYWSHSSSTTTINVTKSSPVARQSYPILIMFLQALLYWTTAAIYFSPACGKLYSSPDQLTKTTYDYIVIGGERISCSRRVL